MPGDFSPSTHTLRWRGTGTNRIESVNGEIILPGDINEIIVAADSNDWTFTGPFCIEVFGAKFDNNTAEHGMLSHYNASGNQRSWSFDYRAHLATKVMSAFFGLDGTFAGSVVSAEFIATVGQAYDITLERDGSDNVRWYIDGSMSSKETFAGALHNSTHELEIGRGNAKGGSPWAGRFKAIRITKAARYADDDGYTVPDLPLPTSA